MPVAASASRAIAQVARSLELERAEVRIASHQHDLERRCSRTRGASPAARPPCAARDRGARHAREVAAVERHAARVAAAARRRAAAAASSCPSRSGRGCRRPRPARPTVTSTPHAEAGRSGAPARRPAPRRTLSAVTHGRTARSDAAPRSARRESPASPRSGDRTGCRPRTNTSTARWTRTVRPALAATKPAFGKSPPKAP